MNDQEKINKHLLRLDYLFTSNKRFEGVLREGKIIREDLRLLFEKDKNLFSKEAERKMEIYSKILDLTALIIKSNGENLELIFEQHVLLNHPELNNKRLERLGLGVPSSEYKKLRSFIND